MSAPLHRPEPLAKPNAQSVNDTAAPRPAAERLRAGHAQLVTDQFSTAVRILTELKAIMPAPRYDAPYAERQAYRSEYRAASERLLVPIDGHRIALKGAPSLVFLSELYPELSKFALPLVAVQDLMNAETFYQDGVHLAVLGHRIHPFYGTYVPNRTVHLELFATWLAQYAGAKSGAVDVGTGSGILALLLAKSGFDRVVATDANPNAIESVSRELRRLPTPPRIELQRGDLFANHTGKADVIAFNPPWLSGEVHGLLDRALYFEPGLFERFFDQAAERLAPDGRIALVFSNIITLVQPDVPHPIERELTKRRFRLIQKLNRKVKPTPGPGGEKRRTREKVEIWELAFA